jgi:hypothetical protein
MGQSPISPKCLDSCFFEMFGLRLTAPYAFIVRARGGAVKVGEDTKKPKAKPSVSGAPSGARTLGTLIKSQVLYQLS